MTQAPRNKARLEEIRDRVTKAWAWSLAVIFLTGGTIVAVVGVVRQTDPDGVALVWLCGLAALAAMTVSYSKNRQNSTRLLHPLVLPLGYMVYALVVPLAYISVTGRGIQIMPKSMLNLPTVFAMVLTVTAYCLGYGLSRLGSGQSANLRPQARIFRSFRSLEISAKTRDIGRIILLFALAAKAHAWIVLGPTYGADQLDYTLDIAIATIGGSLVAVGCLLVMHGNSNYVRRPLTAIDAALILAICGINLFVLGTRSEVIAPLLLYMWFWLKCGKRLPVTNLIVGLLSAAALFLIAAQLRSKEGPPPYPVIENLMIETASPLYVTTHLVHIVPQQHAFLEGSTYLAALRSMLPGPINHALFGNVQGTGALAYRQLTNFTDRGQGWGFSPTAEAYLNYGFLGVVVAALLLGFLFGRSFEWTKRKGMNNSLSAYVYPLLMSYLPFGLRSDTLGQLKSILYPLLIIWIVLIISRRLTARREHMNNLVARPSPRGRAWRQ